MKIASWNVNSIKSRLEHVKTWLGQAKPDVLLLQELKGIEFPAAEFQALGYEAAFVGQKAYNGVAILSRSPTTVIARALPGNAADEQARYLEADINGVRIINIYLPNGNPVGTEKYDYKLAWMDRLKERLAQLRAHPAPVIVGGDYNIMPDERDVYNPKGWENDALFKLESRWKFRALLNLGYTDAFRVFNEEAGHYTFWDYMAGSWPANKGLRIDHFLLSPTAADRLVSCTIDSTPRGWDKASDHTPILLEVRN
jgi:exodeoxyribonuclease III